MPFVVHKIGGNRRRRARNRTWEVGKEWARQRAQGNDQRRTAAYETTAGFEGEPPIFFCWWFQWNSDENLRFHVFFGVGTWNLWWFHWNRGFLVEWEVLHSAGPEGWSGGPRTQPGVRPPIPPEIPGFNKYHHKFSSSYSKNTWRPKICRPSLTKYRQQKFKKYGRVTSETFI